MSILTGMIAPTSGHYNIRYTSEVNQGSRQTDVQTNVQTNVETEVETANTPLSGPNGAQKHHPIDQENVFCDGQKNSRADARTNTQTNIQTDKHITRVDIKGQTERLSENSVDVKAGWVQWIWSVVCGGYNQIVEGDQSVESEV